MVQLTTQKDIFPKRLLDRLYEDIANNVPFPKTVRFQGIEYRTGSIELKKAIDNWYATIKTRQT